MKRRAIVIAVFAALAGCKQTTQQRVEAVSRNVAGVQAPVASEPPKPRVDTCPGLEAYQLPFTYEQARANAPRDRLERATSPQVQVAIDAEGNITHMRFTRLSSLDSVNRQVFESVRKWHYKPTVLNGERVAVCTTVDVHVHY